MDLIIKQSKNSPDTLCIYNGANIKFAHYNLKTEKVSILNNPIAKRIEQLNGLEYLKKAIAERVDIWKWETSPFRKLSKEKVIKFADILLAMGVLGAALDNASQEMEPILKEGNISLDDIGNLREYLNRLMKASVKALGTDLVIDSFDYGEEIYQDALSKASHLNTIKRSNI